MQILTLILWRIAAFAIGAIIVMGIAGRTIIFCLFPDSPVTSNRNFLGRKSPFSHNWEKHIVEFSRPRSIQDWLFGLNLNIVNPTNTDLEDLSRIISYEDLKVWMEG
jgi:hypothetical protein